jgi:hypothetical protein
MIDSVVRFIGNSFPSVTNFDRVKRRNAQPSSVNKNDVHKTSCVKFCCVLLNQIRLRVRKKTDVRFDELLPVVRDASLGLQARYDPFKRWLQLGRISAPSATDTAIVG